MPRTLRLAESSTPLLPPQNILTLSSEDISHFLVRVRRDQDSERWEVRLDAALREILERANDFVPSESGGILLDDPRAKLAGSPTPRLTFIAAFGAGAGEHLAKRVPSDRGICGEVYRSGRPLLTESIAADDPLVTGGIVNTGGRTDSILAVPVIVGDSICGVLQLTKRRSGSPYTARDKELLRIFAAYMSSSIQNALDAIRNRTLARIDDLTGLYNSRYFHIRLGDELTRADRDGAELSVLFIDLDQLKSVNDRFGHIAGSAVLRDVARVMINDCPPGSVMARYGGDEFVAIFPGAKLAQAVQAAETLRRAIENASSLDPFDPSGGERLSQITASFGVASYRDHLAPGGTARKRENVLLRLADAAMYRAKANGRNRVEVAEPED
ncbi:MAG: sensor domain-containing diguanylate cyclase [Pseudomonadota bacterium]